MVARGVDATCRRQKLQDTGSYSNLGPLRGQLGASESCTGERVGLDVMRAGVRTAWKFHHWAFEGDDGNYIIQRQRKGG